MESIVNNPYRILGVEANFRAATLQSNLNKINAYAIAETLDELVFDFDFPALGNLTRSTLTINEARASIDLPNDKIKHALFWFYKGGSNDLPAFDCLKDGDFIEATENWEKVSSTEITERNFSAYLNLSTLYLFQSLENGSIKRDLFADALKLKLKFLESEYVKIFSNSVADSTFKKSKEDIQLLFIESVNQNFVQKGKIAISDLIEILNTITFSSKPAALKLFIKEPINKIESQIEQSKTKRKNNPSTSNATGKQLFQNTQKELLALKTVLGKQDIRYGSIADKLADEILQCGIDYYKKFRDSDTTDPGSESMNCLKLAKSIAVGAIVVQRCNENIEGLQEWINDKPEREKQKRILSDFDRLKNIIDEFDRKSDTIANAKLLINSARTSLSNIKSVLGANDELYLGLSSRIASDAQNMVVAEVNNIQSVISNTYDNVRKLSALLLLKEKVNEAWEVTTMIGNMDLVPEFRSRYNTNKSSLSNLRSQLSQFGASRPSSGGCYIATLVYGSYEHPQVIVLRGFRDNVLNKYTAGRKFITFYYKHSPNWVEKMKDKETLNKAIRIILNAIIKLLK
jgi:hypothetical protein